MKVTFKHKNGREQIMDERYAKILQGLNRGTYRKHDGIDAVPKTGTWLLEKGERVAAKDDDPQFQSRGNAIQPPPKRRGRKPKSASAQ